MPTPRSLPWIIGAAAAGALLWLVFGQRDTVPPPAPAPPHAADAPHPPASPSTPEPGDHAAAHHDHEQPGADPGIDPGAGDLADPEAMSLLPEPPGEGDIDERPARAPLTPEEQRLQNQRALALIDRSIERLEAERKAAEASGDARTAERNRVRIERLRQRRTTLTQPPPEAAP
jgi:hypothetical protein